jgi:hypothetical protein
MRLLILTLPTKFGTGAGNKVAMTTHSRKLARINLYRQATRR